MAQENSVDETAGGKMGHWEQQLASPVASKCENQIAEGRVSDTFFEIGLRDDSQHTNLEHKERDRPPNHRQAAARRSRLGRGQVNIRPGGATKANRVYITITGLNQGG